MKTLFKYFALCLCLYSVQNSLFAQITAGNQQVKLNLCGEKVEEYIYNAYYSNPSCDYATPPYYGYQDTPEILFSLSGGGTIESSAGKLNIKWTESGTHTITMTVNIICCYYYDDPQYGAYPPSCYTSSTEVYNYEVTVLPPDVSTPTISQTNFFGTIKLELSNTISTHGYVYEAYTAQGTLITSGTTYSHDNFFIVSNLQNNLTSCQNIYYSIKEVDEFGCESLGFGYSANYYPVYNIISSVPNPQLNIGLNTVSNSTVLSIQPNANLCALSGASNYQWTWNGNVVGNQMTYTATQAGDYAVTIFFANGFSYQTPVYHIKSYLEASNKHFVITDNIRQAGAKNSNDLLTLPTHQFNRQIQYLDDYGREEQAVVMQGSFTGKDVVKHTVYDGYGRTATNYNAFTTADNKGIYTTNALQVQQNFHNNPQNVSKPNTRPFATTTFENTPIGRPIVQSFPGQGWVNRDEEISYRANKNTGTLLPDLVWKWEYITNATNPDMFGSVVKNGEYYENVLSVVRNRSVEGEVSLEFKDRAGKTLLKRVEILINNVYGYADTYYVYDDLGQLRLIIPPQAIENIKNANLTAPTYTPDDINSNLYPFLKDYAYMYVYDIQGRQIEAHKPGALPTYMVYDLLNRPIMTQDGKQRIDHKWDFVKYDEDGRAIMEGIATYPQVITRATLQLTIDNYYKKSTNACQITVREYESRTNNTEGYTQNQAYPCACGANVPALELLKISYYDDYDFYNTGTRAFSFIAPKNPNDWGGSIGNYPKVFYRNRGSATGTKVKILNPASSMSAWLTTALFYDRDGNVIQTQGENHLGTLDVVTKKVNFDGTLYKSIASHTQPDGTVVEQHNWNSYNAQGAITAVHHQIKTLKNDNWIAQPVETIASYTQNEAGELIRKDVGAVGTATSSISNPTQNDFLQNIDYTYNERGWLTSVNNPNITSSSKDLFSMEFFYNDLNNYFGTSEASRHDGNIAATSWTTKTEIGVKRGYSYRYDGYTGNFARATYSRAASTTLENFSISNIQYDLNGNIKSLSQNGLQKYTHQTTGATPSTGALATFGATDQLTYEYFPNSNRLKKVTDALNNATSGDGGDFKKQTTGSADSHYLYDNNGSMQTDLNKGILINYNALGLPESIINQNTNTESKYKGYSIHFIYDAVGNKLRSTIKDDAGAVLQQYDYINGFVYAGNGSTQRLQFISHEEGRIIAPESNTGFAGASQYVYEYFYKDHQGNLRMVYRRQPTDPTFTANLETFTDDEAQGYKYNPNHTTTAQFKNGTKSIELGTATAPIGPFITLSVGKGDVVSMEAYGKYQKTQPTISAGTSLLSYLPAVLGAVSVLPQGGNNPERPFNAKNDYSFLLSIGIPFGANPNPSADAPKAYLQYVYYNPEGYYLGSEVRLLPATENAWHQLQLSFTAKQDGYVQVFVANESNVKAWFDDVKVTLQASPIAQENHYTPLGLNLAGIEKQGNPNHRWQMQGKEKLNETGLMYYDYGSRYYDPQLGRWHATDPQNQFASPYNAMGNDFVNGTDPDGEFFIGTILTAVWDFVDKGFTDGGFDFTASGDVRRQAWASYDPTASWTKTNRAWEIEKGLFQVNASSSWVEKGLQILSRFTWEAPQSVVGNLFAHTLNISDDLNNVSYFRGRTVLDTDLTGGAVTIGSYITGPRGFRGTFEDHLFVHEFGHTRQSRMFGAFYLPVVGIPSLLSATFAPNNHGTRWFEADASRRAANYFDRHFGSRLDNYVAGDVRFFDRNSYISGAGSPYTNPRTLGNNRRDPNPTNYQFRWYDPLIQGAGIALFLPLLLLL